MYTARSVARQIAADTHAAAAAEAAHQPTRQEADADPDEDKVAGHRVVQVLIAAVGGQAHVQKRHACIRARTGLVVALKANDKPGDTPPNRAEGDDVAHHWE